MPCCNGIVLQIMDGPSCTLTGGWYLGDGTLCDFSSLCPFVDELPLPAVLQGPHIVVAARQIRQQLHRDLPPTLLWYTARTAPCARVQHAPQGL